MKTYKKSDGTLWAFEDDGSQLLITSDMTLLTDEQIQEEQKQTPEQLWLAYQNRAIEQLAKNDLVALRCLKANVKYPPEWLAIDVLLREIVATSSGDSTQILPMPPSNWPAGT